MDKSVFEQILDHPDGMTSEQSELLRRERDSYPYCALLQVLSLEADKAAGTPMWETRLMPQVEIYVMDVHVLQQKPASRRQRTEPPVAPASIRPTADEPFDVLKEINAYQEVSFKTAPKSVILSNFLEKDGGIVLKEEDFEEMSVQELAKKSIQLDEALETETMALMLVRQGKIDKAVSIYRNLIVKYPEKSSIFAARISEAESLRK